MDDRLASTLLELARTLGRGDGTAEGVATACNEALSPWLGPHAGCIADHRRPLVSWISSTAPTASSPSAACAFATFRLELQGGAVERIPSPIWLDLLTILRPSLTRLSERAASADPLVAMESVQRLSQLGERLAGIVHELANPLQSIVSRAELLVRRGEAEDPVATGARILRAALRCRGIVSDVLGRAHPRNAQVETFPMEEAVLESLELEEASGAGPITLEVLADADGTLVSADRRRIAQVVTNLITNARQARRDPPSSPRVRVSEWIQPGQIPSVRIAVEDDGPGVPEALRARIFEPFFTTKAPGEGTGLGLSLSRELIAASGGRLFLDSTGPSGSRFVIELPRATRASARAASSGLRARRRGRILVVDDDRETVETYRAILAMEGHDVVACANGRDALDRLARESFDVILSDLRLPDLPGPQLMEALARLDRTFLDKVVFATGDVTSPDSRDFLAHARRPVLAKPFRIADLCRVLDSVLVTT